MTLEERLEQYGKDAEAREQAEKARRFELAVSGVTPLGRAEPRPTNGAEAGGGVSDHVPPPALTPATKSISSPAESVNTKRRPPGFKIYNEVSEQLLVLDNESLGAIYRAGYLYHISGTDYSPETPLLTMAWKALKANTDRTHKEYQSKITRNK